MKCSYSLSVKSLVIRSAPRPNGCSQTAHVGNGPLARTVQAVVKVIRIRVETMALVIVVIVVLVVVVAAAAVVLVCSSSSQ